MSALLLQYEKELFSNIEEITSIEKLLGGDHRQGLMMFLAVMIVRDKERRAAFFLELQIGQVNSHRDTVFLLQVILEENAKNRKSETKGRLFIYLRLQIF